MSERLTWEEIQERYPDQWVGLADVKYVDDDGIPIESAVYLQWHWHCTIRTQLSKSFKKKKRRTLPEHNVF